MSFWQDTFFKNIHTGERALCVCVWCWRTGLIKIDHLDIPGSSNWGDQNQTTMKIWLQIEMAIFLSSISNSTTFNLCIFLHVLPHFSSEALSALDLHTWTWSLKLEHVWKSNSLGLPSQQSACLPNNGLYSGNKLLLCHFCTFCTHYNKPTWHILLFAHFFQSHFIILIVYGQSTVVDGWSWRLSTDSDLTLCWLRLLVFLGGLVESCGRALK